MLILTDSSHQITMTVSSIAQSLQSSVHPLTIHREQITDIHLCNDETLTDGCGEEVRAQYSTVQGGWGVQRRAIRWETVSKYQIINNYRRWLVVATGSQVAIIIGSNQSLLMGVFIK